MDYFKAVLELNRDFPIDVSLHTVIGCLPKTCSVSNAALVALVVTAACKSHVAIKWLHRGAMVIQKIHGGRVRMQDYLKHADPPIVPSESGTYRTSEIEDVLYSHYKAKPEIMCSCPGWHQNCTTARIDSVRLAASCAAGCSACRPISSQCCALQPPALWACSEVPGVPAQILICLDKHLQIGNCTYDCEGTLPQCCCA